MSFVRMAGNDDLGDDMHDDLKVDSKRVLEQACEFFLYTDVNRSSTEGLIASMLKMAHLNRRKGRKPTFVLNINSQGGEVPSGLALAGVIQQIRSQGFKVHTRIHGMAASMAFILAQFGDVRQIDALATAHIHDIQSFNGGNTSEREDFGILLRVWRRRMAEIYAARNTKGYTDPEYWIDTFMNHKDHYLTPQQALELGMVDEVVGGLPYVAPEGGA
jgi:ATP-dependent protease ClpP protease subunit